MARTKTIHKNHPITVLGGACDGLKATVILEKHAHFCTQVSVSILSKVGSCVGEVGTHFPCRNFLNGFCPRGRLCDFKHDYNNNVMLPPFGAPAMMPFHPGVVIPPPPPMAKKNAAPCRHFEKGYCSLGIACAFQHESGLCFDGIKP